MNDKWPTHLFQYRHDGSTWSIEIKAPNEEDAKDRIRQLQQAEYLGTLQMKIPVELGMFARLICWWQNRQPLKFFLDT